LVRKAKGSLDYDELAAAEELASLYINLGRFSRTEALLVQVIKHKEEVYGAESRNLIDPLVNFGFLKLRKGDYTEAEKIARRTVAIAEKSFGNNSTKLAPPLTLLAEVYTTIGDYEKAETNITRSIQVQEAQFGREHIDVAKSLTQLALVKFYKDDDPGQVEKLFDEARNIIDLKLGNRAPKYADLLKDLAVLYIATNRYDDAFNSLSLAQTIWESKLGRRNNINAAEIYLLTGDIYYSQRNYSQAEESYLKAKKLYERIFKDNHPEYVKVLSKLSKVYYMDGGARKARNYIESAIQSYNQFIKEFFPALSEREKAKFWNTIKGDYEFFNTLAVELKDEFPNLVQKMYNNALTTKALLLNSSITIPGQSHFQ